MSSALARTYLPIPGPDMRPPTQESLVPANGGGPVAAPSVAYQAARAQALLDRIADVSDISTLPGGEDGTVTAIMERLDAREALLADLEPVVAELSLVRGELVDQGESVAQARALQLALAPVEQAARRALGFHEQLLEKMQAMRDEMVWELARLDQLDSVAQGYLLANPTQEARLDVRR